MLFGGVTALRRPPDQSQVSRAPILISTANLMSWTPRMFDGTACGFCEHALAARRRRPWTIAACRQRGDWRLAGRERSRSNSINPSACLRGVQLIRFAVEIKIGAREPGFDQGGAERRNPAKQASTKGVFRAVAARPLRALSLQEPARIDIPRMGRGKNQGQVSRTGSTTSNGGSSSGSCGS